MDKQSYKLWGGRFDGELSRVLEKINNSLKVDSRLLREEIEASTFYAEALYGVGLLNEKECEQIKFGLQKVLKELEIEYSNGGIQGNEEDIHSVVEARLVKVIGNAALKLHTGRSRNEQVVTDTKMWLLRSTKDFDVIITDLIKVICRRATEEIENVMPGYTHLQKAQPVRWSHFLMSHAWSFKADVVRLMEYRKRISECPLGSGALAGCAFPIDRDTLARNLGFSKPTPNSMYSVADRDFAVEFLQWATLTATHLSRIAEDLVIYSSQEFGFVTIADEYSTGSSLMPQKKNPDSLELVRATAAAILGDATALNVTLIRLPSTYNKDMQGDKEIIFRSYDKLKLALEVLLGTVATLKINPSKMLSSLDQSMFCTDLAHLLVKRGVPFRKAHQYAGEVLKLAELQGKQITELTAQEYQSISKDFPVDLSSLWCWASLEQYQVFGGTSLKSVLRQVDEMKKWLEHC